MIWRRHPAGMLALRPPQRRGFWRSPTKAHQGSYFVGSIGVRCDVWVSPTSAIALPARFLVLRSGAARSVHDQRNAYLPRSEPVDADHNLGLVLARLRQPSKRWSLSRYDTANGARSGNFRLTILTNDPSKMAVSAVLLPRYLGPNTFASALWRNNQVSRQ